MKKIQKRGIDWSKDNMFDVIERADLKKQWDKLTIIKKEKIKKPIYKEEKYPFENFNKLMTWAIKSLNQLTHKERFRKLANWEKEQMH